MHHSLDSFDWLVQLVSLKCLQFLSMDDEEEGNTAKSELKMKSKDKEQSRKGGLDQSR